MEKLTKRQEDALNFIKSYMVSHGYPPTVREIAEAIGVSSPATVQAHLDCLANKGYIKKGNNKNRTIELMVENEFIQKSEYDINSPDFKPHTMISQNQYFIEEKYGFSISAPSGAKEYCWSVQEKTISQNAPEKVISTQKDLNYTFSGNYSLGRTYILKLKVTTHNNKEFTDSAFIIIYSSNN